MIFTSNPDCYRNRGFITVHGLNKDRDEVKREGEKKENPSKSLLKLGMYMDMNTHIVIAMPILENYVWVV